MVIALSLPVAAVGATAWPDEQLQSASAQTRLFLEGVAQDIRSGTPMHLVVATALGQVANIHERERAATLQQLEWLLLSLRPAARTELLNIAPPLWRSLLQLYPPQSANISAERAREWMRSNPRHPGRDFVREKLRVAERRQSVRAIALALPFAPPYSDTSDDIASGFIDSYYRTGEGRVRLVLLDSANKTPRQLLDAARAENVSVLVGPLLPKRVAATVAAYSRGSYRFKLLVLNRTAQTVPGRVFSYALSPQGDVEQIIARLQLMGAKRPLVLASGDAWGERQLKQLQAFWPDMLRSEALVDTPDLTRIISQALGTRDSADRHKRIGRLSGLQLEFEPRRRRDMDALVLLAPVNIARRAVPALAFNFSGDLPLLAERRASESEKDEPDLYLLQTTALPLMTSPTGRAAWQPQQNANAFVALGMDAAMLAFNLHPGYRAYGASGFLRVLADGRVSRQSTWARYTQQGLVADERMYFYPLLRASRAADGAAGAQVP